MHIDNLTEGEYRLAIDGKVYRFEWHRVCGPVVLGKRGNPLEPQPGARCPFWQAVSLWAQQGKRVGPDGLCVWDEPPPTKVRHVRGRHYLVVEPGDPDRIAVVA